MEKILVVVRLGANLVGLPMRCTPDSCPTVVDIPVGKIITHPAFNQTNLYNDIALIRLEHAVNETEFIHTICFPRENFFEKSFYGEKLTVAGWGRDDSSGERTALSLRHVELPMRDRCACDANYAPLKLEESQFCVGYDYGGDSCDGDSGGPLMYFDERGTYRERCYILGLVSFGKSECGDSPSVYTNTMAFLDWILDNIVGDESDTSNPQDTQNNNHTC
ncbi:hypothetical protein JTB14_030600 [Gonioctena quinquepunctata]|nr:hypothetical protein JTB14_030600 [Gonioctena quinquepunctata]